mmetsp:Transcript_2893/g.5364  ORF Transcript_2893/g.5364 Transcript_2893/m.5364 type:complete len:324 (-) Transcript_2893:78-1049(-)
MKDTPTALSARGLAASSEVPSRLTSSSPTAVVTVSTMRCFSAELAGALCQPCGTLPRQPHFGSALGFSSCGVTADELSVEVETQVAPAALSASRAASKIRRGDAGRPTSARASSSASSKASSELPRPPGSSARTVTYLSRPSFVRNAATFSASSSMRLFIRKSQAISALGARSPPPSSAPGPGCKVSSPAAPVFWAAWWPRSDAHLGAACTFRLRVAGLNLSLAPFVPGSPEPSTSRRNCPIIRSSLCLSKSRRAECCELMPEKRDILTLQMPVCSKEWIAHCKRAQELPRWAAHARRSGAGGERARNPKKAPSPPAPMSLSL